MGILTEIEMACREVDHICEDLGLELCLASLSGIFWGWEGVVGDEDFDLWGGEGRSKDAGEDEDVDALEPEEVIVLRTSVMGAMFSVSCAALGLGGCCWQ